MRKPLYDHAVIDRPVEQVQDVLLSSPGTWLPDPGKAIAGDIWEVHLHADEGLAGAVGQVEASVHVGAPKLLSDGHTLVRPIAWTSEHRSGSYPAFEGEIEISKLSRTACQVSVFGTYVPPFGPLGGAFDAALGHRVAEAVMGNFVRELAHQLRTVVPVPARSR